MASDQRESVTQHQEDERGKQTARRFKQVQAITGLIIGAFTALHMGNHAFMHFGLGAHTAVLKVLRRIYTFPPVERLLLFSMLVHALVAMLRFRGLAKEKSRALFQIAGWLLIMVMPGHVFFTRTAAKHAKMQDFDVTHAAMAGRIIPAFFIPYYVAMSAAGAYHTFSGFQKAGTILSIDFLKRLPSKGESFMKWSTMLTLVSVSSALAISGVYFRYPMVEEKLLFRAYRREWPKAIFKYVQMPKDGAWFGTLAFSQSKV